MEAIAGEAGVAKATAYAYFPDKEAVFHAVCADVAQQIMQRVADAQISSPGHAQVSAVLQAKFGLVFALVYGSPHAAEILQSSDEYAKTLFEQTDAAFLSALASTLKQSVADGRYGLPPRAKLSSVASMLFRATEGLMHTASTASDLRQSIDQLVQWLLPSV
jgi:AcrR family transcriptional regulator